MLWLNAEDQKRKTAKNNQYFKMRSNLRILKGLKLELKEIRLGFEYTSEFFSGESWNDYIKAIKVISKTDKKTKFLSVPTTASDLGTFVNDVANIYLVQLDTGEKFIDFKKIYRHLNFVLYVCPMTR